MEPPTQCASHTHCTLCKHSHLSCLLLLQAAYLVSDSDPVLSLSPPRLPLQQTLCSPCTRFQICTLVTLFRQFELCGLFPLLLSHAGRMIDVILAVSDRAKHPTMSIPCPRCKRLTPRAPFERLAVRSAVKRVRFVHCADILHRSQRSDGTNCVERSHRPTVGGRLSRATDRSERALTRPLGGPFERREPCSISTLCTRCELLEPRGRSSSFEQSGPSARRRRCSHK